MEEKQQNLPRKQNRINKNNNSSYFQQKEEKKKWKTPQDQSVPSSSDESGDQKEAYSWDFDEIALHFPALNFYVHLNQNGVSTINWKDPKAHKTLNQAILSVIFGIRFWDMPENHLIPSIPSRLLYLDWIHRQLQFFGLSQKTPKGIDIGTGASLIYPLLGASKYQWEFIATEVSSQSLLSASTILQNNNQFKAKIEVRKSEGTILQDIILEKDGKIDFLMCNPPFFGEHEEKKTWINVSMKESEYITDGGELGFLKKIYEDSKNFQGQIQLFSSLIGRKQDFLAFKSFLSSNTTSSEAEVEEEVGKDNSPDIQVYEEAFSIGNTTRWILGWQFKKMKDQKNL